jgi:hypothetical protein
MDRLRLQDRPGFFGTVGCFEAGFIQRVRKSETVMLSSAVVDSYESVDALRDRNSCEIITLGLSHRKPLIMHAHNISEIDCPLTTAFVRSRTRDVRPNTRSNFVTLR